MRDACAGHVIGTLEVGVDEGVEVLICGGGEGEVGRIDAGAVEEAIKVTEVRDGGGDGGVAGGGGADVEGEGDVLTGAGEGGQEGGEGVGVDVAEGKEGAGLGEGVGSGEAGWVSVDGGGGGGWKGGRTRCRCPHQ